MELAQYAMVIWRRWGLVALTTVLAAGAAAGFSLTQTPIYRSSVTLEVQREGNPAENAYYTALNNEARANAYALQVTGPSVLARAAERLGLPGEAARLRGMLAVSQTADTGMIEISARHPDPAMAKAVAEATGEVFIEEIKAQQESRYRTSLAELDAQIAALEARIADTQAAIVSYGNVDALTTAARAELAQLETQLTNDETRLRVMLQSTEQFRLAMAQYDDSVTVFSPAELPAAPVSPRPLRNTALATVVGGMIGVGTAFLLDYLDDTVHTPEDARAALGVNVLGAVPDVEGKSTIGWLAQEEPLSTAAEAFRDLRTSLQYASLDAPLRTLLVTSTEPDEGKTFVAANLATVVALGGRRVLLMEADLRRPRIHKLWEETRAPGLTEALRASSDAQQEGRTISPVPFVRPTQVEGLCLMTSGAVVPTPAELLNSQTFQRMMAALQETFDLIVIDSPPVLAVTDAAVLTGTVDGVVIVTISGQTRLPSAARTIERVQSVGGNLLGLVINRMTARSGGYYYRYYGHGRDYIYGGNERASGKLLGWLQRASRPGFAAQHHTHGAPSSVPAHADERLISATHIVTRGPLRQAPVIRGELVVGERASLAFAVGGIVKAIHVTPGQAVTAGTVLAELHAPEVEEALLARATELKVARLEVAKVEAQASSETVAYELAIARERLKLEETLHERAQARVEAAAIRAPFNGTVVSLAKAPGDRVEPYAPVGEIADLAGTRVHGTLAPSDDREPVEVGTGAWVRIDGTRGRSLDAIVDAVERGPEGEQQITLALGRPEAAPNAGRTDVEIEFADEVEATGVPVDATGVPVDATGVPTKATEGSVEATWVPVEALIRANGTAYVNVVRDNRVERVPVGLGPTVGEQVQVIGGVQVGDTVALP